MRQSHGLEEAGVCGGKHSATHIPKGFVMFVLIAGDSKPDSPHLDIWCHKVSLQALVRRWDVKRLCTLRCDVCLKAG